MLDDLIIDKINKCTPEELERCAFGLFVKFCYGNGLDRPGYFNSAAIRKTAQRIAEQLIFNYPIDKKELWAKSDDVIRWAGGVLDQADEIKIAVLKYYNISFDYLQPLLYILGDRQLETSKKVIYECEQWIEEMEE